MEKNPDDAEGAKLAEAYQESGRASAAQGSRSTQETRRVGSNVIIFTEHTPPPVLIGSGSLIIETDVNPSKTMGGSGSHRNRYVFTAARPIKGLRILDDAQSTIYQNAAADGCSVKIWWDKSQAAEQILVDANTLSIETDVDLGNPLGFMCLPKIPREISGSRIRTLMPRASRR